MTIEQATWKGAFGIYAPIMGYIVSKLAEIEQWLRILSLTGGLIVCALTIRSFIKNWNK
jgi:hypothetical protein